MLSKLRPRVRTLMASSIFSPSSSFNASTSLRCASFGTFCIRPGNTEQGPRSLPIIDAFHALGDSCAARIRAHAVHLAIGGIAEDLKKAAGDNTDVAVSRADGEQRRAEQRHGSHAGVGDDHRQHALVYIDARRRRTLIGSFSSLFVGRRPILTGLEARPTYYPEA
jgi:hypothetical protein